MREISYKDLPTIHDPAFKKYGKVLTHTFPDLLEYLDEETQIPEEGNIYVASDPNFEKQASYEYVRDQIYGGQPIQMGYCNGKNDKLNALEFHKGSETNIAATDFVLILGDARDIEGETYETSKAEAFLIKKGDVFEVYETTLHFSPCKVDEKGFKCAVILPKGTNTELDSKGEGMLFMKNKWILVHPENEKLGPKNLPGKLVGENIRIV